MYFFHMELVKCYTLHKLMYW